MSDNILEFLCDVNFSPLLIYSLEFDIIPVEKQLLNRSPVVHIDHRLGLESWCVKHVYKFANEKYLDLKSLAKEFSSEGLFSF